MEGRKAGECWSWRILKEARRFGLSAPEPRLAVSVSSMKKSKANGSDELKAEYDFSAMTGGVRGKYAARARSGTNLVLLEPDVARAFPSDSAVNEALRAVMTAAKVVQSTKRRRRA